MILHVHDIPFRERTMLCKCLDAKNKWRELGIKLGFDDQEMNEFERRARRSWHSPSDYLLAEWGIRRNGKILSLFVILRILNNVQAMRILRPFVDEKFHYLIDAGEDEEEDYFSARNNSFPPNPSNLQNRNLRQNQSERVAAVQSNQRRSESAPATSDCLRTRSSLLCSPNILYEELQNATNNWDENEILGTGGFGTVFRGFWKNTVVAIKQLQSKKPIDYGYYNGGVLAALEEQCCLKKDLKYLTLYRHDNILPVYAYSICEKYPLCLVYQLMSNGSLEDQLQLKKKSALSWWQRVTIAKGAARGLQYLHSFENSLIHGDIKSANILLDDHFVAKVSDFGLARDGPIRNFTHIDITTVQGTIAYLPPEVLRGKKLSFKVDTYAFGVVLCEMATGLKACFVDNRKRKIFLRDHVENKAGEGCLSSLKDSKAGPNDVYLYEDLIKLGIKCTSLCPKERPSMVTVFEELDNIMNLRVQRRQTVLPSGPEPMHIIDNTVNGTRDYQTPVPIPDVTLLRIS